MDTRFCCAGFMVGLLAVAHCSSTAVPIIATAGFVNDELFPDEFTATDPQFEILIQCHLNSTIFREEPILAGSGKIFFCDEYTSARKYREGYTSYYCMTFTNSTFESSTVFKCYSRERHTVSVSANVSVSIRIPDPKIIIAERSDSDVGSRCFECAITGKEPIKVTHRNWVGFNSSGHSMQLQSSPNGRLCLNRSQSELVTIRCDAEFTITTLKYTTFGPARQSSRAGSAELNITGWNEEVTATQPGQIQELVNNPVTSKGPTQLARTAYIITGISAGLILIVGLSVGMFFRAHRHRARSTDRDKLLAWIELEQTVENCAQN